MKLLAVFSLGGLVAAEALKLRLVHMNDMHSRVEGLTSSESACDDPDTNSTSSICDGGWPRIITAAKQFVSTSDANATIFLEDGDEFMGTLWSSYYRGEEASTFLNMMCDETTGAGFDHCVGTFGNHEFDYGYETLVNYTSQIGFDMISSNINDVCDPINGLTLANQISKNKIIEVDGVKVGIFAYTTPETRDISSPPECVTFEDEITVATAQVTALKAEGANIIIALGHSGYGRDQQILAAVDDIDIVVGGHSHSFLWDEAAQGANPVLSGNAFGIDGGMKTSLNDGYLYPTETENGSLIVQAYWSGRYLGMIDLEFNAAGEITDYTPGTVLVGSDVSTSAAEAKYQFAKDPAAQAKVTEMAVALDEFADQVIGESAVALDGLRSNVRSQETNLGNLICDAMLDSINSNTAFTATNSPVDLCLMNSGGIRASIDSGDVTIRDVLEVLPFGNVLSVVRMTGAQVYLMIEHGLSRFGNEKGEFGQFGKDFRIVFDPAVEAACGKCDDCDPCATAANIEVTRVQAIYYKDTLIPNDDSQTYELVTNDFLVRGGDSYQVLTEAEVLLGTGAVLDQVVRDYIAAQDGVSPETECRIQNLGDEAANCPEFSLGGSEETPSDGEGEEESSSTSFVLAMSLIFVAIILGAFFALKPSKRESSSEVAAYADP